MTTLAFCDLCGSEMTHLRDALEVMVFGCGHLAHACIPCRARHEHPEAPNGTEALIARLRKAHADDCAARARDAEIVGNALYRAVTRDGYNAVIDMEKPKPAPAQVCCRVKDHEGDCVYVDADDPFYLDVFAADETCGALRTVIAAGAAGEGRVSAAGLAMATGTPIAVVVPGPDVDQGAAVFAGEGYEGIDRSVGAPITFTQAPMTREVLLEGMRIAAHPPKRSVMVYPPSSPASVVAGLHGLVDLALELRAAEGNLDALREKLRQLTGITAPAVPMPAEIIPEKKYTGQPDHCTACEWSNRGLLNYSTVQNGPSLWLCHGCAARRMAALETTLAAAKGQLERDHGERCPARSREIGPCDCGDSLVEERDAAAAERDRALEMCREQNARIACHPGARCDDWPECESCGEERR